MSRIKPMLAKPMVWSRLGTVPMVAEEKFDGHRMLVRVQDGEVDCWSRLMKDSGHKLSHHLRKKLETLPNCVLDGELFVPGGVSTDAARLDNRAKLIYVAFDVLEVHGSDVTTRSFNGRRNWLEDLLFGKESPNLLLMSQIWPANTEEQVMKLARGVWRRKGEGLIIKSLSARYEPGKRRDAFMKVKSLETGVLTVIDLEAGTTGPRCVAVLEDDEGNVTKVKLLNDEVREQATDDWIGRRLRITYQFRTKDGSYRHPMWDRWEDE